nr:rhodanese-like domain-containing protein [uncultured Arsenicibacter sp.]
MTIKFFFRQLAVFVLVALRVHAQTPEAKDVVPITSFTAKLSAQKSPQLIDARSAEEFALNHIPDAVNINLQTPGYAQLINGLNKANPVFVYSIANGRSVALAGDLRSRGFREVYVLDGGIGAWTGSGQTLITTAKKGLTLDEYTKIIAANDRVLVDIGSKFCGSCKKVKPVLASLRQQYGQSLTILEIELEESPALIGALKTVTAFPYLILYNRGEVVLKHAGLQDLEPTLQQSLSVAAR